MRVNQTDRVSAVGFLLAISVFTWVACGTAVADARELAAFVLSRASISGGICSLPRCGNGELAVEIAASSKLLVHGLDTRPEMLAAAGRRADDAGLLGARVVIEKGSAARLPYADSFVDLIVLADLAADDLDGVNAPELLRALRPRGKAILGRPSDAEAGPGGVTAEQLEAWATKNGLEGAEVIENAQGVWLEAAKPPLAGVDDWSHWFHDPDNNPVSTDTVIEAPYLTQWLGVPYYVAMPTITTAAAGRIFVATGHIAHHEREVPTLNRLTARNGYNGQVLWTRKLPDGYLVHRSAFIATEETFHLIDGSGCLMLDPETGEEKGRIEVEGITGGWNWMAMKDGVLYVQAGDEPTPAETTKVASGRDHWSWASLSPGYYADRVPWGFGRHLAARDLKEGRTLWTHTEPQPIDSRALGIWGDRLFLYAPDSRIGCLDARSGEVVWTNEDTATLGKLEVRGKGLASTPGFRSNCMALCTEKVLFLEAQTRAHVLAISAEDGSLLWERAKTRNNPTLLFVDGQLITGHDATNTLAVDPLTGEVQKELGFSKVSCTRMTAAPDSLFCRGEGLGRYDRHDGQYRIDGSVRPGCNDGALPANGLLYVGPWCCDCNLSLMGTVTLCSAGDLDPAAAADDATRLELGEGDAQSVKPLEVTDLDWPTYRASNQRGAASQAEVASAVTQAWRYTPKQASKMTPPTAAGGLLFFGREDGKVECLDAATGQPAWGFFTGGPVLQPPTIWEGRAFVGSGDGHVYCLEATTGRMLWRFRPGPVERRIMVYGSLCSTWPVNSGVLLHDGVAYAAAGIIDRDGTYIVALDAKTGEMVWQNGTSGHLDANLRKGVSAQGGLAIARGRLWLAAGNQVSPAAFDLATGEYVTGGKPQGRPTAPRGAEIGVWRDEYVVHGGRLLYSDPGKVVNPGQFSFVPLDENGNLRYPAMLPIQRSSIPPAWNDDVLVALTQRYNQLVCWDSDLLLQAFEVRRAEEKLRQEAMRRNPDPNQRRQKIWATNPILDNLFRHTGKWGPVDRDTLGVALAANFAVTVSGPAPWQREEQKGRWTALGWGLEDGKATWWWALPGEPMANGLTIDRDGQVIVPLKNGEICCLRAK